MLSPANCPALVTFVILMATAAHTGSPPATAIIPNVMDTEKYPSPMGTPSRRPAASELRQAGICFVSSIYTFPPTENGRWNGPYQL